MLLIYGKLSGLMHIATFVAAFAMCSVPSVVIAEDAPAGQPNYKQDDYRLARAILF